MSHHVNPTLFNITSAVDRSRPISFRRCTVYGSYCTYCHFWYLLYRHVRFVSQQDANGETNQVYIRRKVGYIGTEVDEWSGGLGSRYCAKVNGATRIGTILYRHIERYPNTVPVPTTCLPVLTLMLMFIVAITRITTIIIIIIRQCTATIPIDNHKPPPQAVAFIEDTIDDITVISSKIVAVETESRPSSHAIASWHRRRCRRQVPRPHQQQPTTTPFVVP